MRGAACILTELVPVLRADGDVSLTQTQQVLHKGNAGGASLHEKEQTSRDQEQQQVGTGCAHAHAQPNSQKVDDQSARMIWALQGLYQLMLTRMLPANLSDEKGHAQIPHAMHIALMQRVLPYARRGTQSACG